MRLGFSLLLLVLTTAGATRAGGDDGCASCGDAPFPEAEAFLAAQGLPPDQYDVLMAWDEAAPEAEGGLLAGYRVQHADGGEPFDLYADRSGRLLTEEQAVQLGAKAKSWDLESVSVEAEVMADGAVRDLPPTPRPRTAALKAATPALRLPPLDLAPVLAEDEAGLPGVSKGVKRIGVYRDLPAPLDASSGPWTPLPDGSRVWKAAIESPEAVGLRLRFARLSIPPGAHVIVYNADDPAEAYGPYAEIPPGDEGLWSATCFSARVAVECVLPPGTDPADVEVTVDRVVHVYRELGTLPWAKLAGNCNLDVACYPDWDPVARAVCGMGSLGQSGFLWCTGTLLADQDPATAVPYILTANHCVSNPSDAASLEVYWLYQAPACGAAAPRPWQVPRTSAGADYLAGSRASTGNDFALLRLRAAPPPGVVYAGWSTAAVSDGASIATIHHPDGDFKRISFGYIDQRVPGRFRLSSFLYYGVYWTDGVTEPGSSGSPLLRVDTRQVIGQLWGGTSSCSLPNDPDAYGRFDETFSVVRAYLGEVLQVTRPNGGELFHPGVLERIEWNPGHYKDDRMTVELLRGGAVHSVLAESVANNGAFDWLVPAGIPTGDDYRIRVRSRDRDVQDVSDGDFAIAPEPQLQVLAPNGGEVWAAGSNQRIAWSSLGLGSREICIELLKDTTVIATVVDSTENDGEYFWVVPGDLARGDGYRIRVRTVVYPGASDDSDETFSISTEPSLTVLAPNGGETLYRGVTTSIEWISFGLTGASISIEVRRASNPDETVYEVASSIGNIGAFPWTVPDTFPSGEDYLIRIAAESGPADFSDAPFAIQPCAPEAPAEVSASDGTYADRVQVTWTAVPGATEYRVYRSLTDDPDTATPVSAWISVTAYADASAAVAQSGGCRGSKADGVVYYYWVLARNGCSESGFGASDAGHRGGTRTAGGDALVTVLALLALAAGPRVRRRG